MSLVKQEVLTLPEHLSSPAVFCGVRATRSFVCFVDRCLSFCPLRCLFFFDLHILITLWHRQTLLIILKVILASLKIKQTGLKVTDSCLKVTHPKTEICGIFESSCFKYVLSVTLKELRSEYYGI